MGFLQHQRGKFSCHSNYYSSLLRRDTRGLQSAVLEFKHICFDSVYMHVFQDIYLGIASG